MLSTDAAAEHVDSLTLALCLYKGCIRCTSLACLQRMWAMHCCKHPMKLAALAEIRCAAHFDYEQHVGESGEPSSFGMPGSAYSMGLMIKHIPDTATNPIKCCRAASQLPLPGSYRVCQSCSVWSRNLHAGSCRILPSCMLHGSKSQAL